MSEQLTPEWLAEKRRIAEAATPGEWEAWQNPEYAGWWVQRRDRDAGESVPRWRVRVLGHNPKANAEHIAAFDPPTVLALLDEIERLRRERDTLDSGLDGLEQAIHYQDWPAVVAFFRAARRLLDGEKGGSGVE